MSQPCFLEHAVFSVALCCGTTSTAVLVNAYSFDVCTEGTRLRSDFLDYLYNLYHSHCKRRICLNYRTLCKSPLSKYRTLCANLLCPNIEHVKAIDHHNILNTFTVYGLVKEEST